MTHATVAIVGGGIVGLATAWQLLRALSAAAACSVLEKEAEVGEHQTGHNSGVLHSGIYYKPGSLRAVNCRTGKRAMEEFCAAHGVPFDICGKVIVAVNEPELPLLERIYERGQQNGVRCELIGPERLKELEPHAAGVQGDPRARGGDRELSARSARSWRSWSCSAAAKCAARRACWRFGRTASRIALETTAGRFTADYLVTCCGPAQRPRGEADGQSAGGADRAVSRRVLRAEARAPSTSAAI